MFIIYFIKRSLDEYNEINIKYLRAFGAEIKSYNNSVEKYLQEICVKLNENRDCNKTQQVQASSVSDDVMGCDRE